METSAAIPNSFICISPNCNYSTSNDSDLKLHIYNHHPLLSNDFDQSQLINHPNDRLIFEKHPYTPATNEPTTFISKYFEKVVEELKCKKCRTKFDDAQTLVEHLFECYKAKGKKKNLLHLCICCQDLFRDSFALARHLKQSKCILAVVESIDQFYYYADAVNPSTKLRYIYHALNKTNACEYNCVGCCQALNFQFPRDMKFPTPDKLSRHITGEGDNRLRIDIPDASHAEYPELYPTFIDKFIKLDLLATAGCPNYKDYMIMLWKEPQDIEPTEKSIQKFQNVSCDNCHTTVKNQDLLQFHQNDGRSCNRNIRLINQLLKQFAILEYAINLDQQLPSSSILLQNLILPTYHYTNNFNEDQNAITVSSQNMNHGYLAFNRIMSTSDLVVTQEATDALYRAAQSMNVVHNDQVLMSYRDLKLTDTILDEVNGNNIEDLMKSQNSGVDDLFANRVQSRLVQLGDWKFIIINYYGCDSYVELKLTMLQKFQKAVIFLAHASPGIPIILLGDFNFVTHQKDSTTSKSDSKDIEKIMNEITNELELIDLQRSIDGDDRFLFTNTNYTNCRRLDRIYISKSIANQVKSLRIEKSIGTHFGLRLELFKKLIKVDKAFDSNNYQNMFSNKSTYNEKELATSWFKFCGKRTLEGENFDDEIDAEDDFEM
ncbi:uncharacterized protein KGF55_004530 [Candida pseudojiufengensis]|uniref:uncharacterized protein n=1 Tax=Candida pseudojiufengensis TaxID=497109 RepID=UPI002225A5C6|nr:uncharacterized protein KGF55_004530 [Candida pseudojiufengensis]KAI5960637.1 hypothetical protein KGF55_004530 [Candida pseudojiufengensis]